MASKEEKQSFSTMIEQRADSQQISCLEAIVDYCESSGLELEVAATLLNQNIKTKLEEEAKKLHFLTIIPKG
jgi:hypothetical protein